MIAVEEKAKELGINVFALDLPFGEWEEQIVENIQIKYFKAAHSGGKEFSGVAHYCYLISIGEKRIYIAGDADYSDSYQQTMLAGEHVTIGFFNPLYFHFKAGRKLISQINPKRVVMYHIPLENNDKYSFRNLSQRSLERFRENLPPCEIISEEMQKFTI